MNSMRYYKNGACWINDDLKDYVVNGTVRREDKAPLRDLRVRAFHESPQGSIRLGEDAVDAEGRYTIIYRLLPGLASIGLRVEVWTEDGVRLHASRPSKALNHWRSSTSHSR